MKPCPNDKGDHCAYLEMSKYRSCPYPYRKCMFFLIRQDPALQKSWDAYVGYKREKKVRGMT